MKLHLLIATNSQIIQLSIISKTDWNQTHDSLNRKTAQNDSEAQKFTHQTEFPDRYYKLTQRSSVRKQFYKPSIDSKNKRFHCKRVGGVKRSESEAFLQSKYLTKRLKFTKYKCYVCQKSLLISSSILY